MTTALDPLPERIAVVAGGASAIGTAIFRALQDTGHCSVILDWASTATVV
jgi:NADP-dependent 3-hydroxy acid dehydrogenase YdfG